jgi:uncharacterized protein involved in exopolysaccharide biosynthesis
VLAAAATAAIVWPATYRSIGTILIEQQELPSDLVQSTITSYADQRIQVISQRVMTTENLLRIIQRYDLYPALRKNEPREVLLKHMREDIRFEMISADVMDPRQGRATKADIAFTVSYDSGHGDVAARVANELVSLYLDENVKSRRQKTADAALFLQGEAEKLNKAIEALQASIAQFKNQHINSLPDQASISNQTLMRAQDQLTEIDTQLRSLEQQKTYLDAQLAQISPTSQTYTSTGERVLSPADQLKYLRTQYAQLSAIYAPDHPDVVRVKREIEGLEQTVSGIDSGNDLRRQLEQAHTQLATLQQRYAPDHPDVVRLERQISTLTQAIDSTSASHSAAPSPAANADNPAYIQVKAQREAAIAEIDSLNTKRIELQAKVAQLDARLAASPGVERDYVTMLRELDSDQLKYREVQQKEEEAQLALHADRSAACAGVTRQSESLAHHGYGAGAGACSSHWCRATDRQQGSQRAQPPGSGIAGARCATGGGAYDFYQRGLRPDATSPAPCLRRHRWRNRNRVASYASVLPPTGRTLGCRITQACRLTEKRWTTRFEA